MSLDRSPLGNTSSTLTLLGMQVGISLVTQLVVRFFERLGGSRYSKTNLRRYEKLKDFYKDMGHLQRRQVPAFWVLENDKPNLLRLEEQTRRFADYRHEVSPGSHSVSPYHSQSDIIVAHVSAYLTAREQRWFGKGSPGDLLDLFMKEWLDFSTELRTYSFDPASNQQLKARIQYLERALKDGDVFEAGLILRKKDKFEVMRSIRQELVECKSIADNEASRVGAREKMKVYSDRLSKLLWASVQSLYYARTLPVHDEAFNLPGYLNPQHAFLTSNAQKLYPALEKTHTGLLLKEVALKAGLDSFGKKNIEKGEPREIADPSTDYYDADFRPKTIDWSRKKIDLPSWIATKERPAYLLQTQKIGESILRLSRVKRLIEDVCDFTNEQGDAWIYGDKRGKLSVKGLLFLLEEELRVFNGHYTAWYETQNSQRCRRRTNLKSAENLNYNKGVDVQKDEIEKQGEDLRQTLNELRAQMMAFTFREPQQIDVRKEKFYQTVARQVQGSYPEAYPEYQSLAGSLPSEDPRMEFSVDKTLLDEKRLLAQESGFLLARLFPGEGFSQWRRKYLFQRKADFKPLLGLLQEFRDALYDGQQKKAAPVALEIQAQLTQVKRQAESERPAWRLGWFYLQAGWPFKQGQAQKIRFLLQEFELLSQGVKTTLATLPPDRFLEEKTSFLIQRRSAKRSLNPFESKNSDYYNQNNKSTLFIPEFKPQEPPVNGGKPRAERKYNG